MTTLTVVQTGAGVVFEPNSPRFRVMIIKTTRKKIDMAVNYIKKLLIIDVNLLYFLPDLSNGRPFPSVPITITHASTNQIMTIVAAVVGLCKGLAQCNN